jgi:hypothetical protein
MQARTHIVDGINRRMGVAYALRRRKCQDLKPMHDDGNDEARPLDNGPIWHATILAERQVREAESRQHPVDWL